VSRKLAAAGAIPLTLLVCGCGRRNRVSIVVGERVEQVPAAGERVVLWSVDTIDWAAGVTPAQIKRRVREAVQPGSIVLLDDGGDQSATVVALPGIIRGIGHRHLKLVALTP
jgi:peptidoglycan/xylan/chitin deacetylase (PgdA/CDA1 family)